MGSSPSRVVIMGGAFDPIHYGHLRSVEQARTAVDAEQAWLIPCGVAPHRPPTAASGEQRLQMVQRAAADLSQCIVVDYEVKKTGYSYTIDTVDYLRNRFPDTEMWCVIGSDAARAIRTWHRYAELMERVGVVIVNRQIALSLTEALSLGFREDALRIVESEYPDVSATEIRRRVASGQSLAGLTPDSVIDFVAKFGLYREQMA